MLTVKAHVKPGDWVRFQQNGALTIGVVQYVRDASYPYQWEAVTDVGTVTDRLILEVRAASTDTENSNSNET